MNIITSYKPICLFCGKEEQQHYEEYESYYECDCDGAKKTREIKEKIEQLKRTLPTHNFEIKEVSVLRKKHKHE